MKREIGVLLVITAVYVTVFLGTAQGAVPCGTEMTYIDSQPVFSNGSQQGSKNLCVEVDLQSPPPPSPFGYQYHCTELVDRYFDHNWPGTDGRDYFLIAATKGFAPLRNGESPVIPKHGDAIGFDNKQSVSDGVGHIALIDRVWQNYDGTFTVEIVEQNWGSATNPGNGRAQLQMMQDVNGRYRIADRGSYLTQGWLRYFPPPTIAPGMYSGPFWNSSSSYAFLEAYERAGGKNALGDTDTRIGETPYVHEWCVQGSCVALQDFWGGQLGDSAIILNKALNKAYLVRIAFWEFYRTNEGPIALGEPIEEEHAPISSSSTPYPCPVTMLSCQAFRRGTLFWNGSSVIPISNPDPIPPSPPILHQVK